MAFIRRKSGVYHDDVYYEDFEPQRRRRLSKPNTKSIKDFSAPSLLSMKVSSNNIDVVHVADASPTKVNAMSSAVAILAARFEKTADATISQISLPSTKPSADTAINHPLLQRRADDSKPSVSSLGSDNRPSRHSPNDSSLASSLEQIVSDPAPPARRTASFTPGMATRVESRKEEHAIYVDAPLLSKKKRRTSSGVVMGLSEAQLLETWKPPPSVARPTTPLNLEYGNILGSLRIANGATSPISSVNPRTDAPTGHTTLRRDTSSVYPESELGSLRTKRNHSRNSPATRIGSNGISTARAEPQRTFSFNPDAEQRFTGEVKVLPLAEANSTNGSQAHQMAEDYIAELARSPFASPSPPDSPYLQAKDETISESPPTMRTLVQVPHADEVMLPSEGSVRRFPDRVGGRSFMDEIEDRETSTISISRTQAPDRHDSPASFFSMSESNPDKQEQFSSALELQSIRSASPAKSNLPQTNAENEGLSARTENIPTDSGYSSNESLRNVLWQKDVQQYKKFKDESKLLIRKPLQLPSQPIFVHHEAATGLAAPVVANIELPTPCASSVSLQSGVQAASNTANFSETSMNTTDKSRNKLKKQQRKPAKVKPNQLIVQRLASVESFNIPPVSSTAKTNLALRVQALPALNRTFKTQEDTAQNPRASVLSLVSKATPVRFPSPDLGQEEERATRSKSKPRARRRSISRPRSWFGWSKEEKRDTSVPSAEETKVSNLKNLGDVVTTLGSNPYDIAHRTLPGSEPTFPSEEEDRPISHQRRTTPSNITNHAIIKKPMMDDATASKVSERRRLSRSETRSPAVPSFDDRGGVPGRLPHTARLSLDAPPLPPMPTKEELNKRLSLRFGNVPPPVQSPELQDAPDINAPNEDAGPPVPPPHSPRPGYIDQPDSQQAGYFSREPSRSMSPHMDSSSPGPQRNEEEEEMLPIPPPHSPAPQTVDREGRSREVSWTDQADAWRERARSASANLRHSWHEREAGPWSQSPSSERYYDDPSGTWEYEAGFDGYDDSDRHFQHGYQDYTYNHALPNHSPEQTYPDERWNYDQRQWQQRPQTQRHRPLPRAETWSVNEWSGQPYNDYERQHHAYYTQQEYRRPPQPVQRHSYQANRSQWAEVVSRHRYRPDPRQSPSRLSSRGRDSRPSSRHNNSSRPNSRHSQSSRRSLAVELHSGYDERQVHQHANVQHMPQLGRYSGGLEYMYHSAGARSVSAAKKPARQRNSWLDMQSYGLDMNDVPAMQVPVGVDGHRMVYR